MTGAVPRMVSRFDHHDHELVADSVPGEVFDGFWVASRYAEIEEAIREPEDFGSSVVSPGSPRLRRSDWASTAFALRGRSLGCCDVSDFVVHLASDMSGAVKGTQLIVDMGATKV